MDQTDLMLGICFAKLDMCVWMHLQEDCIKPYTLMLNHRRHKIRGKTHLSPEYLCSSSKELPFLCALMLSATEI